MKSILNVKGEPIVVHAVQQVFHEPQALTAWPDDDHRSRIVFITRGLTRDVVENMLTALTKKQGEGAIQEA